MKSNLHKIVMRRVWYAYGILLTEALLTSKAFWQGVVFGGALLLFGKVVHVSSVVDNTLATPLGQVPNHILTTILTAVRHGDVVKVVTLLLLVSITISILRNITFNYLSHWPHTERAVG